MGGGGGDLCPNDSLIISLGIPWYLAFVAQEWRMVYEVTADFSEVPLKDFSADY